jgi:hypothetical protein
MNYDSLWYCVKALASSFGDTRQWSDESLLRLEDQVMTMGEHQRADIRRDFATILGGLSRLEMRLAAREEL